MLLRLFGGLDLTPAEGNATRKTALVMAVVALSGARGARRGLMCELLWPDRGPAQARGSLRQALAALRGVVGQRTDGTSRLESEGESVRLRADTSEVDVHLFERLSSTEPSRSLAQAADLYRGDLLAGIPLTEALEDWVTPYRRAYRGKALALCERLSHLSAGEEEVVARGEALAERLLAGDPTAEEAHRALIRVYQRRGRTTAALRQFELCREALRRDLGVEPEQATRELLEGSRTEPARPPGRDASELSDSVRSQDRPSVVVMPFDNLSGPNAVYEQVGARSVPDHVVVESGVS